MSGERCCAVWWGHLSVQKCSITVYLKQLRCCCLLAMRASSCTRCCWRPAVRPSCAPAGCQTFFGAGRSARPSELCCCKRVLAVAVRSRVREAASGVTEVRCMLRHAGIVCSRVLCGERAGPLRMQHVAEQHCQVDRLVGLPPLHCLHLCAPRITTYASVTLSQLLASYLSRVCGACKAAGMVLLQRFRVLPA